MGAAQRMCKVRMLPSCSESAIEVVAERSCGGAACAGAGGVCTWAGAARVCARAECDGDGGGVCGLMLVARVRVRVGACAWAGAARVCACAECDGDGGGVCGLIA